LWHPQALAVAHRQFRYAILTQCRAIPRSCRERTGCGYIQSLVGTIQGVVARFDADAAPVAAERNCQKNLETQSCAASLNRTECVLNRSWSKSYIFIKML
jgi:hypothetical protein